MTDVELQLLTDPDMYLFVEEGIWSAISMISDRYGKANNPYIAGYDSTQDKNYIMYLDINNLYRWAMSQPLPTHDFFWLTEHVIPDHGEGGYILEVDLEYRNRTPRSPRSPLGLSPSAREDESDPTHVPTVSSWYKT